MNFKNIDVRKYSNYIITILIIGMFGGIFILSKEKPKNTPIGIVYSFLTAETIDEKMQYVLDEEDANRYLNNVNIYDYIKKKLKVQKIDYSNLSFEEDYYVEKVGEMQTTRVKIYPIKSNGNYEDSNVIFYLKKVGNTFKIDFEPYLRQDEASVSQLLRENITEQKEIKVYAHIDPYNNQSIAKEIKDSYKSISTDYYSINIIEPDTGFMVKGFLKKGNKTSEYIYNYLSGACKRQITIKAHYNVKSDEYSKSIIIDDISSFTWAKDDKDYDFSDY